jgi:hypothetical protein
MIGPVMSIHERRRVSQIVNKMHAATGNARSFFEIAAAATSVLQAALHRANGAERTRCIDYADRRLRRLRPKPPKPPGRPPTKREEFERRQRLVAKRQARKLK